MRTFNLVFRTATIALLALVVLFVGTVRESAAAIQVTDKLSFFGDFRFRYEMDFREDAGVKSDRDRARIRARFGLKYDLSKNVRFGFRLRTESDNNQSPHQTLALLGGTGTNAGNREDFGLDQAYIEIKYLEGGFLWLGKHPLSFWQQNEAFWDADVQPEGAGLGYKWKIGEAGNFTAQFVHTLLNEVSFGDSHAIFDDDYGDTIQGVYSRTSGDLAYTLALGALFVTEQSTTGVPGGSTAYSIVSGQVKTKFIPEVPLTFGLDYLWSDYDLANRTSPPDVIGQTKENRGFVISTAAKYQKWGLKIAYYYIELNSVGLQGLVSQDDFRYSTNTKGWKVQVGYNFDKGYNIDFRIFPQSIVDDTVTSSGSNSQIMNVDDSTRYQVNLNIKF